MAWHGGNLSHTSMILYIQQQQEWKCTDKEYKQPVNKIYAFNSIVIVSGYVVMST